MLLIYVLFNSSIFIRCVIWNCYYALPCLCSDSLLLLYDLAKYCLVVCVITLFDSANCLRVVILVYLWISWLKLCQSNARLKFECLLFSSSLSSIVIPLRFDNSIGSAINKLLNPKIRCIWICIWTAYIIQRNRRRYLIWCFGIEVKCSCYFCLCPFMWQWLNKENYPSLKKHNSKFVWNERILSI